MTLDKTPETIHTMFNMIAKKYDLANNIMSFGMQKYCKNSAIKMLAIKSNSNVIDLCCGTGDLSAIIKKFNPNCQITGIDFSENMLKIAKSKHKNIQFWQGDVTNLPYEDNFFDIAVMGFGLRNILNAEKSVEEVYRVLKPNGQFLHLDFGRKNLPSKIYEIITPILTKIFTDNPKAYSYLIKSKREFPEPQDLIKDFESKGFKLKKRKDFIFGVISAQLMQK